MNSYKTEPTLLEGGAWVVGLYPFQRLQYGPVHGEGFELASAIPGIMVGAEVD